MCQLAAAHEAIGVRKISVCGSETTESTCVSDLEDLGSTVTSEFYTTLRPARRVHFAEFVDVIEFLADEPRTLTVSEAIAAETSRSFFSRSSRRTRAPVPGLCWSGVVQIWQLLFPEEKTSI